MIRLSVCLLGVMLAGGWAALWGDGVSLDVRRRHVAEMPDAEKADLPRRFREFSALSDEERVTLRRLHDQIESDPEAARLRTTIQRYCRWLEALPPVRRAELMDLKPDERIKRIKSMLDEQAKWEAKRPPSQDLAALTRWLEQYVTKHEAEVIRSLPEMHRRRLDEANPAARKRLLMWWRWQAVSAGILQPPSAADFAELRKSLSADTRSKLESKSVAEQARIIGGWLKHTTLASSIKGGPRMVDEQQLSYFFEHELSEAERDRLLGMPVEQMQHELVRMYHGPHGKPGDLSERRPERGAGKRSPADALAPWRKPPPDRPLLPGLLGPRGDDDKDKRGARLK